MAAGVPITIVLRIPGKWSHPKELIERLPAGFRFSPEALILPDKTHVEFGAMEPDDKFAQIFRSSCRRPATDATTTATARTVRRRFRRSSERIQG
jgi:hypothetical protein